MTSDNKSSEHITDHDLERYNHGMIVEGPELAALEEHLLACPACAEHAQATADYSVAMRRSLVDRSRTGENADARGWRSGRRTTSVICVLLGIIDAQADMVITNYDGVRVWLKDAFDTNGKRIGVAACCPESAPCPWHEALGLGR